MQMNNIKSTLDNLDANTVSQEQLNRIIDTLSGREMELEINKRQQQIEEVNTIKIQSETKIEGYKEEYRKILNEFKAMNIDPKNIKAELLNLCKEIVDTTIEMDKFMPDIETIKKIQSGNITSNNTTI